MVWFIPAFHTIPTIIIITIIKNNILKNRASIKDNYSNYSFQCFLLQLYIIIIIAIYTDTFLSFSWLGLNVCVAAFM